MLAPDKLLRNRKSVISAIVLRLKRGTFLPQPAITFQLAPLVSLAPAPNHRLRPGGAGRNAGDPKITEFTKMYSLNKSKGKLTRPVKRKIHKGREKNTLLYVVARFPDYSKSSAAGLRGKNLK